MAVRPFGMEKTPKNQKIYQFHMVCFKLFIPFIFKLLSFHLSLRSESKRYALFAHSKDLAIINRCKSWDGHFPRESVKVDTMKREMRCERRQVQI